MTTKTITCVRCEHKQVINTYIDKEGFCAATGWTELRDHIDAEHPAFAARLDAFLGPDDQA